MMPDYHNHPGHADHDPNLSPDFEDAFSPASGSEEEGMTIGELRQDTAYMPASTKVFILDPWGNLQKAAILTIEDLPESDPLRHSLPPDAIVLTEASE